MPTSPVPSWLIGLLGAGGVLLLNWLERRRLLRRSVEPKLRREARNLSVAGVSAVVLVLAERPLVMPLAVWVAKQNGGLVRQLSLPLWLEVTVALLLMDYTFYLWHVLMHRVPFLWRFHLVHHVDLDVDASTALRFHFMEMLASIPWRAGQVLLIGLTPFTFSVWQCFFLLSILFHHSKCPATDCLGAVAEPIDRDSSYARNPSFNCGAGNECQLVEWPDVLGLAAWHAAIECATSGGHDWRTGISGAECCDAAPSPRTAF